MKASRFFATMSAIGCMVWANGAAGADPVFDGATEFAASEVLPETLQQGTHHRVAESVTNDGFMNIYTIESDYGHYEVRGEPMLRVRIREIEALAELDRVSTTQVFVEAAAAAAKEAITKPVDIAASVATRPVQTLKGAPAGIKRLFQRQKRSVEKAADTVSEAAKQVGETVSGEETEDQGSDSDRDITAEAKEGAVKLSDSFLGVSTGQRRWAKKLGVDPYSTNAILQSALKDVARVDRMGDLATSVLVPVPSIPGLDIVADVNDAVWELDSYELLQRNVQKLREMGVAESDAQALFANENITPTAQSLVIAGLERLPDVAGRGDVISQIATATSEEQVRFYVLSLATLSWAAAEGSVLTELIQTGAVMMARTEGDTLLAALPLDYLSWSPIAAEAFAGWEETTAASKRALIMGDLSPLARENVEAGGWAIETGLGASLFAEQNGD